MMQTMLQLLRVTVTEESGFVTDLVSLTIELMKHLNGCEHISIEANYDLTG